MNTQQSPWSGLVPVDDTALAVTDTGGPGQPVVYLNGSYASQAHWRHVIATLGDGYRHITFDERARGKSRRSADYSLEGCVGDVDAVLEARGAVRPILVGWSAGAAIALLWADRHPEGIAGVVAVDGGVPFGITGEEARERIRQLFHRMRWLLPIVRPFGLAARMSADQHAEYNIEVNEVSAAIGTGLGPAVVPGTVRPGDRGQPRRRGRGDGADAGLARPGARPEAEPHRQRQGRQQPLEDPAQRLPRDRRRHPRPQRRTSMRRRAERLVCHARVWARSGRPEGALGVLAWAVLAEAHGGLWGPWGLWGPRSAVAGIIVCHFGAAAVALVAVIGQGTVGTAGWAMRRRRRKRQSVSFRG